MNDNSSASSALLALLGGKPVFSGRKQTQCDLPTTQYRTWAGRTALPASITIPRRAATLPATAPTTIPGQSGANAPSDAMGTGADNDSGDRSVTDADDEGNALEDNDKSDAERTTGDVASSRGSITDARNVTQRLKWHEQTDRYVGLYHG